MPHVAALLGSSRPPLPILSQKDFDALQRYLKEAKFVGFSHEGTLYQIKYHERAGMWIEEVGGKPVLDVVPGCPDTPLLQKALQVCGVQTGKT